MKPETLKTLRIVMWLGILQAAFLALTVCVLLWVRHELRQRPSFVHSPIASASSWKRFVSEEGRFSIFFPGVPQNTNLLSDAGTEQHMFFVKPNQQNLFLVGCSEDPLFARMSKLPDPREFLKLSQTRCVSSIKGKIVFEQESKFGNYPAREFECTAGGKANYSVRMKIILAGQRFYEIQTVFLTANPYPLERETFFNSFKIRDHSSTSPAN